MFKKVSKRVLLVLLAIWLIAASLAAIRIIQIMQERQEYTQMALPLKGDTTLVVCVNAADGEFHRQLRTGESIPSCEELKTTPETAIEPQQSPTYHASFDSHV